MARGKAARAQINTLPDEILVDIISLLTCTDEAVRTCAISKRWSDLWKHVNRISFITNDNHYMKGRKRYPLTIQNVNQVLESHQSESLDEFKIHYPLKKAHMKTKAFDKWLRFAMNKGVRQLDIDLDGKYSHFRYKSTATKIFQSPGDDDRLVFPKFLKHLSLNCINVGDNIVEQILSNCPFLEHLRVSGSAGLNDLRVVGSSLQLKFLQISDCLCLSSVEIFAPNLKSFVYDEIAKLTVLNHAPALVNVSLGGQDEYIHRAFGAVANYSSQLETLNLNINFHNSYYAYERCKFPAFSELTRLQELSLTLNILIWRTIDFLDLNRLTCLVEQSPFLRKFTLEVRYMERYMERWGKRLVGFVVCTSDTKVAICLLESANSLLEEFEEDADLFKENFDKCIAGRPSEFETNLMIHMPTCFKSTFKCS